MPGRRSTYSENIANEILRRISKGEPLSLICQDKHMPDITTVFNWEHLIEGFSQKVTLARERSADYSSYEIQAIADTPEIGETITEKPVTDDDGRPLRSRNGKPIVTVERRLGDMIEHRKLRINTRIKLMQMLNRKKYGDEPAQQGGIGPMLVFPAAYIEAVNRALGFTGELKPIGVGEVIEGQTQDLDVLPE
jgi:hypothetical protein